MKLLVAEEVARILRVDRQRVYEITRENILPAIKLGQRQYRYSEESIRMFLERGGHLDSTNGAFRQGNGNDRR